MDHPSWSTQRYHFSFFHFYFYYTISDNMNRFERYSFTAIYIQRWTAEKDGIKITISHSISCCTTLHNVNVHLYTWTAVYSIRNWCKIIYFLSNAMYNIGKNIKSPGFRMSVRPFGVWCLWTKLTSFLDWSSPNLEHSLLLTSQCKDFWAASEWVWSKWRDQICNFTALNYFSAT